MRPTGSKAPTPPLACSPTQQWRARSSGDGQAKRHRSFPGLDRSAQAESRSRYRFRQNVEHTRTYRAVRASPRLPASAASRYFCRQTHEPKPINSNPKVVAALHPGRHVRSGSKLGRTQREQMWSAFHPTADVATEADYFPVGRVEDGRGSLGHSAAPRFPSPLIEPDVPISGIRLSDWLHREAHERNHRPQASSVRRALFLRLTIELSLKNLDHSRCLQAHRQSPSPRLLRKHTRSQGPFLRRHYTASSVL